MHPALSIIFFTTASGLGYGLLAWAGLLSAAHVLPPQRGFGIAVLGLSLALVSAGLLSSMLHLGRPERAWRAVSQWRTSWLSREGVAALVTYIPTGIFAFGWVILGTTRGLWSIAAAFMTVMAVTTVYCTAMIYRSLAPIRQWSNTLTVPVYLVLALMTGAAWLHALTLAFGVGTVVTRMITGGLAVLTVPIAYSLKRAAWKRDHDAGGPTIQSATGLNAASVRSVEWPHTEENYLLKEMGYRIARKHAARLRIIATGAGFVIPLVLFVATLGRTGILPIVATGLGAVVMMAGVAIERWLFFAEAKHTVALYYGLPR